ncbi:MAG: CDP-alcohol phosphatidyltransferase family protein [Desulfarculales bacterium]|jgi:phosphatidylglycerophosphate synthase|nr:CDP-alcohol phosphatidyltransferase family protein [Desulfarculales bacterium]
MKRIKLAFFFTGMIPSWITPNRLTGARIAASLLLLGAGVAGADTGWLVLLMALSGLSDYLDGMLARLRRQVTSLGAYLDPMADKIFALAVALIIWSRGWVDIRLLALALLVDVHVWLLPLLVWRRRVHLKLKLWPPPLIKANAWGKAKTAVLFVGMGVVVLSSWLNMPLCLQGGIILIVIAIALGCMASLSYVAAWFKGAYL